MSALVGYNINTDGLSLYLDARNPTSYPGNGNIWYDLSTGGNNVSTGSMYYVSAGLTSSFSSSFVTGSTNTSSMDFYAPNLTSVATIETVCRFNSWNWSVNASTIFGWGSYYTGFNPSNGVIFTADGTGAYSGSVLPNLGSSKNGSAPILGVWYYLVFEMYDGNMPNNKIWVNRIQQSLFGAGGTGNPSNQNFNNGNGALSKFKALNPAFSNVCGINDYAMFRVYNRTLSQAEITNNYNYYKPIYNLA
jgi:hypothetical protein